VASAAPGRTRPAPAPATPPSARADLVRALKQAWEARDIDALVGLLDPEATVIADGGGLVAAALEPIAGRDQIARYLVDVLGRARSVTVLERTVNGQPGLVAQQDGVTVTVWALDVAGDRITRLWAVRNPDKLRTWTAR
jgi:RNA polymerase sigma-70 factor (ECF subfamily)